MGRDEVEEVAESIKTAWAAVEESGVPEHMQESAFKQGPGKVVF